MRKEQLTQQDVRNILKTLSEHNGEDFIFNIREVSQISGVDPKSVRKVMRQACLRLFYISEAHLPVVYDDIYSNL